MVSALRDQRERGSRAIHVGAGCNAEKRPQIRDVLRTRDIVSGENFQRNQMCRRRDTDTQLREELHFLGRRDNLVLDPGGRKQEIDQWTARFARTRQPCCGEAAHRFLFDERFNFVVAGTKTPNECFRFGVAANRDSDISVASESRFGSCRYRESADQRERMACVGEISANLA